MCFRFLLEARTVRPRQFRRLTGRLLQIVAAACRKHRSPLTILGLTINESQKVALRPRGGFVYWLACVKNDMSELHEISCTCMAVARSSSDDNAVGAYAMFFRF